MAMTRRARTNILELPASAPRQSWKTSLCWNKHQEQTMNSAVTRRKNPWSAPFFVVISIQFTLTATTFPSISRQQTHAHLSIYRNPHFCLQKPDSQPMLVSASFRRAWQIWQALKIRVPMKLRSLGMTKRMKFQGFWHPETSICWTWWI